MTVVIFHRKENLTLLQSIRRDTENQVRAGNKAKVMQVHTKLERPSSVLMNPGSEFTV